MAPDLNSVPPSPRPQSMQRNLSQPGLQRSSNSHQNSQPSSRRTSQIFPMNPPRLPLSSPGGQIPNASTTSTTGSQPFPPLSPSLSGGASAVSPLEHIPSRLPRPMTTAELHAEMEKEQEAVVNRLTRELNTLRAHSASVASTTSSTSNPTLDTTNSTHPISTRQHRSSSTTSQPSNPQATPLSPNPHTTSTPSHRPSVSDVPFASTPSAMSRQSSISQLPSNVSTAVSPQHHQQSFNSMFSTPNYESVALHRQELEDSKQENERLKRRIRELEGLVRGRRTSSVGAGAGENAG